MNKNWYGFNHEEVNKNFTGGLTYLNDFCVNGEYAPVAVYKVKSPDKSKGHKKYLLLQTTDRGGLVRGMSPKEIKKFRYQKGVQCLVCNDIIYSVNRHDWRHCNCRAVGVDGGKDYFKLTFDKVGTYKVVNIDLITNKISDYKNE